MKTLIKKCIRSFRYVLDFARYRRLSGGAHRFVAFWGQRHPCLDDAYDFTPFDRHYIYHPAWAARLVQRIAPAVHVDISSSLTFSTILSAYVPVRFYDYRVPKLELQNLSVETADLLSLPFSDNSIPCLSCMHVVEHIGLGRYGDVINPDADLVAMQELSRVVAPGGHLIFVVPVAGTRRLEFNAHRVYTPEEVIEYFSKQFILREFSLISDQSPGSAIITNPSHDLIRKQRYGCGCFWFQKSVQGISK